MLKFMFPFISKTFFWFQAEHFETVLSSTISPTASPQDRRIRFPSKLNWCISVLSNSQKKINTNVAIESSLSPHFLNCRIWHICFEIGLKILKIVPCYTTFNRILVSFYSFQSAFKAE